MSLIRAGGDSHLGDAHSRGWEQELAATPLAVTLWKRKEGAGPGHTPGSLPGDAMGMLRPSALHPVAERLWNLLCSSITHTANLRSIPNLARVCGSFWEKGPAPLADSCLRIPLGAPCCRQWEQLGPLTAAGMPPQLRLSLPCTRC